MTYFLKKNEMYKIVKLENSYLEIEIIPELGGRIQKLLNKKTSFDWVWKNEKLQISKVEKGINYDDNWQGGWEELFPNDAIEKFSWGEGFDHGETWSHDWSIVEQSNNTLLLETLRLDSKSTLKKKFILINNRLRVEYQINVNFEDVFLFKLHLAIPIFSKSKIEGDFNHLMKVDNSFGNIINNKNKLNFFDLVPNSKLYDFAYVENLNNYLNITQSNNLLKLIYDKKFLKYLWIFQTQGGWKNHNVLVLEPASNGRKLFNDAIDSNLFVKGPKFSTTFYEVEIS